MIIEEILYEEKKVGTYAAVEFSKDTQSALEKFCKDNKVPEPVSKRDMHCTLLYSHKYLPKFKAIGKYDEPMIGTPLSFHIWKSRSKDEKGEPSSFLVLRFTCPELTARHKELMKEHDAQYDFTSFKAHITLSYNCGELKAVDLPVFRQKIEIVSEYGEDLS